MKHIILLVKSVRPSPLGTSWLMMGIGDLDTELTINLHRSREHELLKDRVWQPVCCSFCCLNWIVLFTTGHTLDLRDNWVYTKYFWISGVSRIEGNNARTQLAPAILFVGKFAPGGETCPGARWPSLSKGKVSAKSNRSGFLEKIHF